MGKNLFQVALDHVKTRIKPETYQIFDLLVNKQMSARAVSSRLRVNLASIYYAQYKASSQIKKEVKRLQGQSN